MLTKPKEISSLINKILAVGLLLFFIVPPVLKVNHAYEYHSILKECEHTSTHFHSSSLHNDALDYFFQPLYQYYEGHWSIFERNEFITVFQNYQLHLSKQRFYKVRLRGPPSFC